jgi:hypothetical protein
MPSLFKSTKTSPYHLSVGAVLVDKDRRVACHYFGKFVAPDQVGLSDFYVLMRETVEAEESMEDAVLRGISEEFGATGEIQRFLGSIISHFKRGDTSIEKTTAYFLVDLRSFDIALRMKDDEERMSEIQWQPIDFLIEKMKKQVAKHERTDIDESIILERVKKFLEN